MSAGVIAFACAQGNVRPTTPVSLNGGTLHYEETRCYAVYPDTTQVQKADTLPFACGAVIIGFADNTRWSDIRQLLKELGIIAIYNWFPMTGREDPEPVLWVVIEVPVGKEKQTILKAEQHPRVTSAGPNYLIHVHVD
jgi:hypothetical protein